MDLNEQLFHLKKDYTLQKSNVNNEKRRQIIDFVSSFQDNKLEKYEHDAALGSCLFGLLLIEQEYKYTCPDKSELYLLLKKCLNITTIQAITDYEATVYLFRLYEHIKENPRNMDGLRTFKVEEVQDILNKINLFLKKYFQNILKNPPAIESLKKNFIKIAEEYKPKKTYFGFGKVDETRDKDIKRIVIIDEVLNQLCLSDDKAEKAKERAYKVRFGTLLYMMTRIEDSYRVRSPENSSLYKLCQRVTCLKNTSLLSDDLKKEYYNTFIDFIATVQFNLRWRNAGLETADHIDKEWKRISAQSYLQRYSFYLMDYAAHYGVQIVVGTVAATMLSQFRLTGIIIANTAQWIAPEYAVLLKSLAPVLGDQLNTCVVSIVSGVVSQMLIEPIGKPMILITFSSTRSLQNFLNNIVHGKKTIVPKKHLVEPEFHQILPHIPENILSNEDNEKIQNIIGYEEPRNKLKLEITKAAQLKWV